MSNRLDLFVSAVREEVRLLDVRPRALRRFGLVVGGVLAAVGAGIAWRGGWSVGPASGTLLVTGGLLALFGALAPRALQTPYLGWMTAAFALGFVMTRLILGAFFFLVIAPTGVIRRTFGESPIRTRPDPTTRSYWIARPRAEGGDRERLERMY